MTPDPFACPHCGQPVADVPPEAVALSPLRRRLVDLVRRRPGITVEGLAEALYADDPDGGPEDGVRAVRSVVRHANAALRPHGWRVARARVWGAGYRLTRDGA
jgi:hypothetical protein